MYVVTKIRDMFGLLELLNKDNDTEYANVRKYSNWICKCALCNSIKSYKIETLSTKKK